MPKSLQDKPRASARTWSINNQQDKNLLDVKGLDWLNAHWMRDFVGYYDRKAKQEKLNY